MDKELLNILKAIADESRLRILCLLQKKELCVCEMENIMNAEQSNISRHLGKLKDRGLINSNKKGQFVFHSIDPEIIDKYPFITSILEKALASGKYNSDAEKMKNLMKDGGLMCKR